MPTPLMAFNAAWTRQGLHSWIQFHLEERCGNLECALSFPPHPPPLTNFDSPPGVGHSSICAIINPGTKATCNPAGEK